MPHVRPCGPEYALTLFRQEIANAKKKVKDRDKFSCKIPADPSHNEKTLNDGYLAHDTLGLPNPF